ncbi:MAG: peptidoglycan-binding domain-containing protein [Phormidesmis sp.]
MVSRSNQAPPTLLEGSKGQAVKKLQAALAELKILTSKIDGIFGPDTCQAVMEFQRSHQLTADGVVGPKTWADIIPD